MTLDFLDRAQRVTKAARVFLARLKVHESYQAVFETSDGKRVLEHICRVGYVFSTTFVKGDPHETALREGRRQLAIAILKHVCRDHGELQKQMEVTLKGIDDE